MKKHLFWQLLYRSILVLIVSAPLIRAEQVVYICDSQGFLGTVKIPTGAVNVIGDMGHVMTDIAFDPSGNLYGITFTELYRIDKNSGQSTLIGALGISDANALVFSANGTMYSAGSNTTQLYRVNRSTGHADVLGTIGLGYSSSGDLEFVNGNLFLSASNSDLIRINLSSLANSVDVGPIGFTDVFGLASENNNVLYGIVGTTVLSVDTTTGSGTQILDYGGHGLSDAYGASEPPARLLLWRNYSNGANTVWYMNNTVLASTTNIAAVTDLNWRMVGSPDLNRDGYMDILWRNQATGANAVWYMRSATRIGTANLAAVTNLSWRIVGTPDMNGDGKPDLLWRNYTNGANVVWYMNGTAHISTANLAAVTDLNWRIVGTPDVNLDGKPDIVWRNYATGANVVWYMNGTTHTSTANLLPVANVNWHIVTTQDMNLDGHPDLVWRNRTTGANSVWYMNGATRIGTASIATVPNTYWYIENNGDY